MKDLLDDKPMGTGQIIAVITCITLSALDGFDVLAIAFAGPGVASDFGVSKSTLGIILATELLGMGVGATVLGQYADRVGRRPIILLSLVIMTLGLLASSLAPSILLLGISRVFTGIGIGAVLSVANAATAEVSNTKYRSFNVTFMGAGFSIGGVLGGLVATQLLQHYDWRSVFYLGTVMTAISIPLVIFTLPESASYLAIKRPENALERLNAVLKKLGQDTLIALPEYKNASEGTGRFRELFGPRLRRRTLFLWVAFMGHIFTVYFVIKWSPTIAAAANVGVTDSEAAQILVWINLGALAASFLYSLLTMTFNLRALAVLFYLGSFISVSVLGLFIDDFGTLKAAALFCGFFIGGGTAAIYPLMAHYFPPNVRAGGIGFVLGVGRAAAIAGPVAAGFLLDAELTFSTVAILLACGSLCAALAVFLLGERKDSEDELLSINAR